MNQAINRFAKPENPPSDLEISEWIGNEPYEYWKQVRNLIELIYPNIFAPEWLFGGKKHIWTLRYKKSRSFCTLIPEKNRFALLIVFGVAEWTKVEAIKDTLSASIQMKYDEAKTYHDGKWLLLWINSENIIENIIKLLELNAIQMEKSGHNNCLEPTVSGAVIIRCSILKAQ